MNNMSTKKDKLTSIQCLRAIAFIGILAQHSMYLPFGAWGASVFIVLSGFIMAYIYYDRQIGCSLKLNFLFSLGKIKKLYPLHITMLIAVVFLELIRNKFILTTTFSLQLFKEMGIGVLLLQAWVPNSQYYYLLNGVAWYLCVCVILYFVFPWIIEGIKGKSNKFLFIISIIVYTCIFAIAYGTSLLNVPVCISDDFSKWLTYICPVFRIGDFFIGCCFGCVFKNNEIIINQKIASFFEVIVVAIVLACAFFFYEQRSEVASSWFIYSVLFTPSSVMIILLFALNQGIVTRLLKNKILVYIGDMSAYGFLIHQVLIKYVDYYFEGINRFIKMLLVLSMTLLLSELFKRIENRIKGYLVKR